MKKKSNKFVIGLFILFICLLSLTIYTSFSTMLQKDEIVIKSMTPVYDETSGIIVEDSSVIFNDKNQVVKYNVVLENTQDYDVKISDIKLSTPTEEFLSYKVEGISKDDVVSANSTKELTVSFETMRIDGWGRNFADELTANISFEKYVKPEEVTTPEEDNKEEKQPEAPAANTEELTSKTEEIKVTTITEKDIEISSDIEINDGDEVDAWIYPDATYIGTHEVEVTDDTKKIVGIVETLNKEEVKPGEHNIALVSQESKTLGYISVYINEEKEVLKEKVQDTTDKEEANTTTKPSTDSDNKVENPYTSDKRLIGILGIATCITGVAIIIVSKNKFAKYTVFILMLSPAFTITNAEEVIEVSIKNNVSFESQNVMDAAYEWIEECWEECDTNCWETDCYEYWEDGELVRDCYDEECEEECWEECDEEFKYKHFWEHASSIKNFYIKNEVEEIENYKYKYDVSQEQNGRVIAYLVENSKEVCYEDEEEGGTYCYDSKWLDLYLQADGIIYPNEDMSYYFAEMSELEKIDNIEGLDTSNVTNMSYMFYDTRFLDSLDLSSFNTSNVTNMSYMFYYTGVYKGNFALDLSSFNTSKVTNMSYMFYNIRYLDSLDLSNFNTSKVTNMSYMFYYTGYNNTEFTLDVSSFDTSNVINMNYMFYYTGYTSTKLNTLITIKNPNTNYSNMFSGVATKEGSQITVNYTSKTSGIVDKMIDVDGICIDDGGCEADPWDCECLKYVYPNVVKGDLVEIITDDIDIGDEIALAGEHFNVISQTDDTITMLAQYNVGTDYKQSTTTNSVTFSESNGWEYQPGPKEIDVQTWGKDTKTLLNNYVSYLQTELGDTSISGDFITLTELKVLGCTISDDYSYTSGFTCANSSYKSWLVNNQIWWTSSANSTLATYLWFVTSTGSLSNSHYNYIPAGVRPTITISKDALKNLG